MTLGGRLFGFDWGLFSIVSLFLHGGVFYVQDSCFDVRVSHGVEVGTRRILLLFCPGFGLVLLLLLLLLFLFGLLFVCLFLFVFSFCFSFGFWFLLHRWLLGLSILPP